MSDRKPQKSNLWKWLLGCGCLVVLVGVVGAVALTAGGVYLFSKAMTLDPVKAKAMADTIYASELPPDYEMKFGMSMFGWKMVAFANKGEGKQDTGMFGMVMLVPKSLGMDKKQMESQMSEQAQKNAGRNKGKVEESEEVSLVVGSEEVKATRQIVTNQNNAKMKNIQYMIFLEKPAGNLMIMLSGPEDGFDEDGMESYLRSIKFQD